MAKTPWTDPDPQPGDFDTELDRAGTDQIEIHEGNPDTKLSILVSVKDDDAECLERIAPERASSPERPFLSFYTAPERRRFNSMPKH